MSIKKDNVSATAVKYNNQDVNKVILDNKCVWCKAFTYTQGTLPTGVASLTCTRSSTDEPTASTGTISNGGTIYYDDKLYWTATASTGYRITAIKGSSSPVTVSGAVTGTTASGLTSARISGTISQGTLPTGVASIKCYRKAYNGSSFSEYTGSTIYYGDQFYWTATATTGYNNPSLTYNSSSKAYTWNGSQGGAITSVGSSGLSAGSRKSFTITFSTTANKTLYGSWSKSSQTAYYGDKITVSGTTVTCYKWDATSTARWSVTATASSNTAQYTYSSPTLVGSSITSVTAAATFTASNTRTLNSYTITWKYLSAYPDTWTTATEAYTYGATPSRTASNVTSGSARKVPTGWDSLATVTGNRTITANYKTQFNVTFSGTRCSAKIDGVAVSNGWYDSGKTVTWTADTNCAFSSNGSTTTTTDTISNQKTTYTATAGYINVTSIEANHCRAKTTTAGTTDFLPGWYAAGTKIYWIADPAWLFPEGTGGDTEIRVTTVVPGLNHATANVVKSYKLTISATNGSYGTYSVSRTSSPYQGAATGTLSNGATIYYGDVLAGTSSAKAVDYDSWSVTSVTAPTFTTTGDATSGNLTIKNNSSYSATLYYNTSNAVGGTSAGTVSANSTKTVTGLDFNKQYYISARVSRTRTKHTYATDGTQYSGTSSVTGNVTATFKFKDTTSTDSGTIDSSVVPAKTAAQSTYTITWKYLSAYPSTWTTTTQSYKYGTTPSRTSPDTVTSGNERKVFASWDSLATVTGNRTITATYNTQYAPTINPSYCKADKISGKWYAAGTVITWTANDNYSFGGSTVKDTTTTKIEAGNVTYSKAPGYVKCTIEGTRCTPSEANGSILAVGTDITYTAQSGYSYTEHATTASNPDKHTVALGTTSYSRSCKYKYITVSGTNCSADIATGYRKINDTITWMANSGTNYKYSFSNTSLDTSATANISTDTDSYSKTASYLWYNVTIKPDTNCTADKSSGYLLKDSTVKFTTTPATDYERYSFSNADSTVYTKSATVITAGQIISSGTAYIWRNVTFSGTNCKSNLTAGWHLMFWTILWTANTNYAFDSAGTTTASDSIVQAGQYTKTADYGKYTVSASNSTANVSTGWYQVASSKSTTFTANDNYSFGGSTLKDTTTVSSPVPGDVSASPNYCQITVMGTNCTIKVGSTTRSSGWSGIVAIGTTITWTANTNYAFNSSGKNTDTATVTGPNTYIKTAGYGKYTVSATNCTANVSTGWYSVTSSKSTTFTANNNWSFGGSNVKDTTTKSAAVPGTVLATPTYCQITVSGSNCTIKVDGTTRASNWSGLVKNGAKIIYTANTNYAFDANGTSTKTVTISGPNTYSASPTYAYYALSLTNCTYQSGSNSGWYSTSSKPSTVVKANSGWSFAGSSQDTKTIGGSAIPSTASASPTHFYLTFSPTNCTCSANSGYYTASTKPSSVTWTPNTYYSFAAGTTQQNSTTSSLASSPTTYSASPLYVRAKSIETGTYNSSVDKNANTYYAANTVVTWTAKTNYYYGSSSSNTTSTNNNTKITAGAAITAPNPTHVKCTISGTNCTANKTSGSILAVGTVITWTPNTNYSFSIGSIQTNTTATVSSSSLTYSASPVYVKPASVSLVRCTCTVNDKNTYYDSRRSYLVSADTNCAFNSTGTTTTQSLTLTAGAAVSYDANYINVTKLTGTNCSTTATTGWKIAGTKITWTANAAYAFDDASNIASWPMIAVPGENKCTASYIKHYKLSVTKKSNVSSIKVWRESSPYQNAAISSQTSPLVNGTGTETIYYGDTMVGEAVTSSYYHFSGYADSKNSLSMSGTVTDNITWAPTVVGDAKSVTIAAGEGITSVYLSSSSTATSGSASGATFPYGSTVYGFAALNRNLLSSITLPSGWTAVGSGESLTYRVGSGTVAASGYNFGTINATLASYPISLTKGTGISSVFLSTSSSATSGSASGTSFKAGTTVYAFVVLNTSGYQVPSGSNWSYVGNGNVYRIGSVYVTGTYSFGTINATAKQQYTVTVSSNRFGIQNAWLSTSSSATTGSTVLSVTSGTKVYGYAVLGTDTYAAKVKNWTLISGTACKQGAIYRVGSKTITAATSFAIELFNSYGIDSTLLFTRSGEGVGSWTVESHTIQAMDDQGYFTKEGKSIYFTGDDYDGTPHKMLVGTFSCPGGYTSTITITDCGGQQVAWNKLELFSGPYTIEAETESTSSSQS